MSTPGSQTSLKEANVRRLLRAVRTAGSLTQAEIARATGLSHATVSNIVRDLGGRGVLEVAPTSSGGRRAQAVSVSRDVGLVVGVDFGHRHLRVALGDLGHRVLDEVSEPIPADQDAEAGLGRAAQLLAELLARAGWERTAVLRVAMGLPAPVDATSGEVGSSSILPRWVGVRAAEAMSTLLGLPVQVDNDANLGALGESTWGSARGARHAAYLKVSTGVGAGLVIDGRVHRGASGTAGEIGHTTMDEAGPVCRCGNRGCLETYVGAPHLLELLRTSHGPDLTLTTMIELAVAGDTGCRRVVADAGRHLGVAVANLVNLFNPDAVVVGGDLAAAGEVLLAPLREQVSRGAIPSAAARVVVRTGALGDRAEVLGALALALSGVEVPLAGAARTGNDLLAFKS